jgi:hypothetical protein
MGQAAIGATMDFLVIRETFREPPPAVQHVRLGLQVPEGLANIVMGPSVLRLGRKERRGTVNAGLATLEASASPVMASMPLQGLVASARTANGRLLAMGMRVNLSNVAEQRTLENLATASAARVLPELSLWRMELRRAALKPFITFTHCVNPTIIAQLTTFLALGHM